MTGTASGFAYKLTADSLIRLQPPVGYVSSYSRTISRNGNVVIGSVSMDELGFDNRPGYWDSDNSFSFIEGNGFIPQQAWGVSADGSVIVGRDEFRAYRWTPEENAQSLPLLSPEDTRSNAWNVSSDGRWTVGWSGPVASAREIQAVRWDAISAPVPLLAVEDGWGSRALRVSDDGQTIAGDLFPPEDEGEQLAALWTEETGLVPLQDLLTNSYGLGEEIAGWHLRAIYDMSGDGRFILGDARNPEGDFQLFLVDLGPDLLPGDYNNNGLVEQADLDLVLGNWGGSAANVPTTWTNDLPTGNIDQNELDGVLANWGDSSKLAAASAAVPEPGTAILLLIGIAATFACRHVHQHTRRKGGAAARGTTAACCVGPCL